MPFLMLMFMRMLALMLVLVLVLVLVLHMEEMEMRGDPVSGRGRIGKRSEEERREVMRGRGDKAEWI